MASGKYNTMSEGLAKIASDIPDMMSTPDGMFPENMDFLTELLAMVVQKQRDLDISIPTGPGGTPVGPPPGPPAGGGIPPEIAALIGAGGPPPGPGPLAGGLQRRPGIPNPDDLARLNNP